MSHPTRRRFLDLGRALGSVLPLAFVAKGASAQVPGALGLGAAAPIAGNGRGGVSLRDALPSALRDVAATGVASFDAAPYVEAAIAAAVRLKLAWVDFDGLRLRMDRGVEVPMDQVGLRGAGARITATQKSGALFAITGSTRDRNLRSGYNTVRTIESFEFLGPGADSAARAIVIDDTSPGVPTLANLSIKHCFFQDFASDIVIGRGAFCLTAFKCVFMALSAPAKSDYSIEITGADNSGERNEFIACQWANRTLMVRQRSANASTFFSNCSFDYSDGIFIRVEAGSLSLTQCHIEGIGDTEHWIQLYGADSMLRISDSVLVVSGPRERSSPFYADRSVTGRGLLIRDLDVLCSSKWTTFLVAGDGQANARGLTSYTNAWRPPVSRSANLLADGGFESARWQAEWTVGDSGHMRQVSGPTRSGKGALLIEGQVGGPQQAVFTADARPGDYLSGELFCRASGFGGGAKFLVRVAFLGRGGAPLAPHEVAVVTSDIADWQRVSLHVVPPAPAGTVKCELLLSVFGVTAGTPRAVVDDIVLNLA